MKKEGWLFVLIFIILLVFSTFILSEGSDTLSTTEWLMYGRTLNHSFWDGQAFTIIPGLNNANYTASEDIYSSPTVANGYVYIGSDDDNVYQLNASNVSQQIATYTTNGDVDSSPAIVDGYLYIGSYDHYVYQLNASNVSQQIANYSTGKTIYSSPAVANGYVYIGSDDNSTYQLNASNISQQIANYTTGGYIESSPAVANGYVYIGSADTYFYQLNASNISQQIANYTLLDDPYYSSPAVTEDYVYIGCYANVLYQLNASDISQQIANYTIGAGDIMYSSPAVANGYVYVGGGDDYNSSVYQLNASDISQQIANYSIEAYIESSPAVAYGYVYIGTYDYRIYQLNASNVSQQIANYTTGAEISSSPAVANGYMYIGGFDGVLYQLNASNIGLTNNFSVVLSTPVCNESWTCTEWGSCSGPGGSQTRTCTDANLCGTTASKPVESQSCDSGSISSTSSASSGGSESNVILNIVAKIQQIFNVDSPEIPLDILFDNPNVSLIKIILNVKKEISNASVVLKTLNNNETILKTGLPIGKVYQAFDLSIPDFNPEDITNVTLNFKVNKTLLSKNNITFHHREDRFWLIQNNIVGNIKLYRNPDDEGNDVWVPLTTGFLREDEKFYYFASNSSEFATFAIFFNRYDCLPNSARCADNQVQLCLGNSTWLVMDTCSDVCKEGKCESVFFKSQEFHTILITAGAGVVAIAFILFKYKRIKSKNKFFKDKKLERKKREKENY
jgi:outer membrane protein assembly factor BamB